MPPTESRERIWYLPSRREVLIGTRAQCRVLPDAVQLFPAVRGARLQRRRAGSRRRLSRRGFDAGLHRLPDAGPDAGADAGGPSPYTGCTCGRRGRLRHRRPGRPAAVLQLPARQLRRRHRRRACGLPRRCAARPPCCFDGTCRPSISCAGSGLCVTWLGASAPVDGTPCDDGRACTARPRHRCCPTASAPTAAPTETTAAPTAPAPSPSTRRAPPRRRCARGCARATGGNGGSLQGGRCCPAGMACDFGAGPTHLKCLGNLGHGLASNDVCRAGACRADDTSTCP